MSICLCVYVYMFILYICLCVYRHVGLHVFNGQRLTSESYSNTLYLNFFEAGSLNESRIVGLDRVPG